MLKNQEGNYLLKKETGKNSNTRMPLKQYVSRSKTDAHADVIEKEEKKQDQE